MDTPCAWVRNDLQPAEPQKREVNKIHHSSHWDSQWGTAGAFQEHPDPTGAPPSDPSCPSL